MIAERETTKILEMIAELQAHLGMIPSSDAEIKALQNMTDINQIADELDLAEKKSLGEGAEGPKSAADTSR